MFNADVRSRIPSSKKHLGVYPLIEIYLFVNPLDRRSVAAEEALLKFSNDCTEKVKLTILPLVNHEIFTASLAGRRMNLDKRNAYMKLAYKLALDFKAAQIQGKKLARTFLLKIQSEIFATNQAYSEDFVQSFFTEHGDYAMFLEDRSSTLVKELFWRDQQLARKFDIHCEASALVYNCTHEGSGLLLEGLETIQEIPYLNYLQMNPSYHDVLEKNKAYN